MSLKYKELSFKELKKYHDLTGFEYKTTEEFSPVEEVIGQERAVKSIEFGLNIEAPGYNIYITGMSDTGRTSAVREILEKISPEMKTPSDWCYIYNFQDPDCPLAINLPPGKGREFKKDMRELIKLLSTEIPQAFESEDYKKKRAQIAEKYELQKRELISKVEKIAKEKNFQMAKTPLGFTTIPLKKDGQPFNQLEFQKLKDEERKKIETEMDNLQREIAKVLETVNSVDRKYREELNKFNRQLALFVVEHKVERLKKKYKENPLITNYLNEVKLDLVENVEDFLRKEEPEKGIFSKAKISLSSPLSPFIKYDVNVVVDNSHLKGAPVIIETNPTYQNMFGRIEKRTYLGAYITDFTRVKAGSILKANGGYLVVDVEEVLKNPFVWDALKRTLRNKEARIEDIGEEFGFLSVTALRPMPIPLNIKVIMIGKSEIFNLLSVFDTQFKKIFKVRADFDYETKINKENILRCARFICKICKEEKLKHFDKEGISAVIEYSNRLAEDQEKISLQFGKIANILREANYWATKENRPYVTRKYVEKAIEENEYRGSLIKEKIQEMIERSFIYIDVEGKKVGQINGLSIYNYGELTFGKPTRITAQTFMGDKGVINIEREAKLSGKTHDKGVLILSGYLGGKYGINTPFSLSATITFEQSYSYIEGDSASSTELFAILSSLSGLPIDQGIAVTGSVNQKGEIQPIGGVNYKIEGFFEVCRAKGLTGKQGVIIPKSNTKNLMLKKEVIEAVRKEKFHIYPISTIDEGMEILTGVKAGERGKDGKFPKGTVNYLVEDKLLYLMKKQEELRKKFRISKKGTLS
ncbi:AAA family ATPase [Candidatus Aerophobetes bacterium]|nr:AAA family ATPase [Candidatus Aerophobetes bacterium]